ncbi:MAG TPA: DUF1850 domain-containing protein [Halomonas sp.]|nr:DUF1850 domain-containing protein [Halomonas sp.]
MTKAVKAGDRGRAARLALLLPVALLISLALALQASARTDGKFDRWLQVVDVFGEPLVSVPMPAGAGWCLAWNHSVEGFTVHDCYRNRAGRMLLERSHLPDFAAGLDHVPGRGRQISDGRGGYWIEDINEPVPGNRYRLRVGSLAVNHRLVSHGTPSLEQLLNDSAQTGCTALTPGVEAGAEAIISLSDLAANQGVTVQLVASTSCYHGASEPRVKGAQR